MMERGVNPRTVMEILGHSTIAMTLNRYSHVTLDVQREAIDGLSEQLGD